MKSFLLSLTCMIITGNLLAQNKVLPVIDMHLHALPADFDGPPPIGMCAPFEHWSVRDAKQSGQEYYVNTLTKNLFCGGQHFLSATTDDSLLHETLKVMQQYNVYGVASGPFQVVQKWRQAAPDRILPGIMFSPTMEISPEQLRKWFSSDSLKVLGEITGQYDGITLSDSIMEPYLTLAEQMDVPISVHVGPGPPGIAYAGAGKYRARHHSALVLEEALIKHPKLRIIVAHAGWPMIDDMLAVLYAHPQVYVDLGIICYGFPKKEFYAYLQRMIDAGFGKRICFGSDQMIWPQTIRVGIESIMSAPFLTEPQKRDILYNNAAKFLRLTSEEMFLHRYPFKKLKERAL
ncbi:amidohydrolase family protein [Niabella sp. CJ426]|uniref:amidohydrolase family protein n=1 Tax=Niabella sp. CJ426 TaxID=3393740 RepID=UPI003D088149